MGRTLEILPGRHAICRLPPGERIPVWVDGASGDFLSVTRTREELSIVCAEGSVPAGIRSENGWRCLKVRGPLDVEETGVLAELSEPLAGAGIPIFVVSTFDTDYILVRSTHIERAADTLRSDGHHVDGP